MASRGISKTEFGDGTAHESFLRYRRYRWFKIATFISLFLIVVYLIVDVSQTALASGINNELFQPGAETMLEFYAEKPIALRMVGTYHQFGAFVSGVASLPRVVIMTMHDISLKPRGDGDSTLVLEGTVKTYRYLDEDEVAGAAPATTTGGVQ